MKSWLLCLAMLNAQLKVSVTKSGAKRESPISASNRPQARTKARTFAEKCEVRGVHEVAGK